MALRLPLDHDAFARGGSPMFRSRARAWTRDAVWAAIDALRRQTRSTLAGASQGEAHGASRWVLLLRDRANFTIASAAAWAEGAIAVAPAHATSPAMQRATAGGGLVLTDDPAVAASLAWTGRVIDLSARDAAPASLGVDPAAIASSLVGQGLEEDAPDANAWVFETSGSRSEPTLHPRRARDISAEARALSALLELAPRRVLVGTAPPTHLYGALFTIVAPLSSGCTVVCESPLHAGEIVAALAETHASVLVSTPAHLAALMASEVETLTALTAARDFIGADVFDIVSSGAALPQLLCERLDSLPNVRVTEILGATETGGIAWRRGTERTYRALPGVRWRTREGVFEVSSPWCQGATDDFVETREAVEVVDDQTFLHRGRRDDVLKVAGRRISLAALEDALRAMPGVEDVALAAIPDDGPRGQEIVGVVVGPGVAVNTLVAALREGFDPVVVPRRLRHVSVIERDARGKVSSAAVVDAWRLAERADFSLEMTWTADGDGVSLHVPNPTAWTWGHFRSDAIVPGAALLAAVARAIEGRERAVVCEVRGAKFHAKVSPGDSIEVAVLPSGGAPDDPRRVIHEVEARRGGTAVLRAQFVLRREASP